MFDVQNKMRYSPGEMQSRQRRKYREKQVGLIIKRVWLRKVSGVHRDFQVHGSCVLSGSVRVS